MSDVLGVSITGLKVSQHALRTTGHNIANAGTEGYSRQSNEINSIGGSPSGVGFLGNGAYTANIERIVNDFVIEQIRHDTSLYTELNAYDEHIQQLNDVLANSSTGLTQGLESFFASLQNVTDDPTSTSARQLFISESENLADRFNIVYTRIDTLNESVNQNLEVAVNQVNVLTQSLAELNQKVTESLSAVTSQPNDLLDQRDEVIRELSSLLSIQTVEQDNQINVSTASGLPLVVSTNTTELQLGRNEFDPLKPEIYLEGLSNPITDSLNGGEISGLLDFQQTVINPAINDLGRIGIVLADTFNELHNQGITADNTFGSDLFFDVNNSASATSRILSNGNNTSDDYNMSVSIDDSDQLTASDYRLIVYGVPENYLITRLSDNTEVASGVVPGAFPASITFDGLSLDITAGTFTADDEFLIQPTRYGARDFSANALQPVDLALGSPVATDSSLSNLGNAQISPGEVLGLVDSTGNALPLLDQVGQMSPPLLIQFTTPTSYDILDNSDPGNPTQLNPPIRNQVYVPGIENSLFTADVGQTTVTSGGTVVGLPATRVNPAVNEYPAETFTFATLDPNTGAIVSTQNITSTANASAKATAAQISNVDGVDATAFNYLELRDFTVSLTSPLQITVNGEDLIQYDAGAIAANVPSPTLNSGEDFNDYLAEQINVNTNLSDLGIHAVSAYDATAGEFYTNIFQQAVVAVLVALGIALYGVRQLQVAHGQAIAIVEVGILVKVDGKLVTGSGCAGNIGLNAPVGCLGKIGRGAVAKNAAGGRCGTHCHVTAQMNIDLTTDDHIISCTGSRSS